LLFVVAARPEAEAVLRGFGVADDGVLVSADRLGWRVVRVSDRVDVLVCGVGKSNAAGAVGWCLGRAGLDGRAGADEVGQLGGARNEAGAGWCGVVSFGIGGALPLDGGQERSGGGGEDAAGWGARIGDVVVGSASVYGDEGIVVPMGGAVGGADVGAGGEGDGGGGGNGFLSCLEMGFALSGLPGDRALPGRAWLEALRPVADRVGVIATVSTCSGTDELAREIRRRTGGIVEGMEGASVGLTVASVSSLLMDADGAGGGGGEGGRVGVGFAEVRVVSNTTGDRGRQVWDIGLGLRRLSEVGPAVAGALLGVVDGA